jgi:hypothetical protein
MEPGEALGIAAQIAVTLAGFAGVVVVFRRESVHEWSAIDKLRLRLLLANSILPLVLVHDWAAIADHQARADSHLEVVQRVRVPDIYAVRRHDDEDVSSRGSATITT